MTIAITGATGQLGRLAIAARSPSPLPATRPRPPIWASRPALSTITKLTLPR